MVGGPWGEGRRPAGMHLLTTLMQAQLRRQRRDSGEWAGATTAQISEVLLSVLRCCDGIISGTGQGRPIPPLPIVKHCRVGFIGRLKP